MPTPTFDGDNLLIILPASEPVMDVQVDLYSDWKEWFKTSDNAKYPIAFSTSGGEPTQPGEVLGRAFFLRNDLGWRIRPAEEDADVLFEGSLFPQDFTLPLFVPTTGAFTVSLRVKFSNLSLLNETLAPSGGDVAGELGTILSQETARTAATVRTRLPGRRTS